MTARQDVLGGAQALGTVMLAEHDLYRAMLAAARREQDAIVAGDVETLTALVDEQESLIEHLHALETERMTAMVAIAAATGIDADTATLSEVAALLPAEPAADLTRYGQDLRAGALALRELHTVNAQLLRSSRSLIDRWIHYMRSLLVGSLYTADGDTGALPGGRALDRSA